MRGFLLVEAVVTRRAGGAEASMRHQFLAARAHASADRRGRKHPLVGREHQERSDAFAPLRERDRHRSRPPRLVRSARDGNVGKHACIALEKAEAR
jgi:hypothetical protein